MKRIVHAFSTRPRIGALAFIIAISGWFVTQMVFAEKEMNVYVFPSHVDAEGWDGDSLALGQDLSLDATFADFTLQNSAALVFGETPLSTSSTSASSSATSTPPADTVEASFPPIITLPSESEIVPVPETTTTPGEPLKDIPNPFVDPLPVPAPETMDTSSPQSLLPEITPALVRMRILGEAFAHEDASGTPSSTPSETLAGSDAQATTTEASSTDDVPRESASNDPYSVASCVTLGLSCHLMTFVGFGLGDALEDHPLTRATLELSLAARENGIDATHDRIRVRIFHEGSWEYLGETEVKGEISNAKRGGYLSYELPSVLAWKDLADLKVVVEYVREGKNDASAFIDGIWVNAHYSADAASASSPEDIALTSGNVRSALFAKDAEARKARKDLIDLPDGTTINLIHVDDHPDAEIEIRSDKAVYHTLGNTTAYLNVTNKSDKEQTLRLQFHFPEAGGGVGALYRYSRSVPHKVSALKYDAVGYFCSSGWEYATSSENYSCAESAEVRRCDATNDDRTNCIVSGAKVGLVEDTEYRDGWLSSRLSSGSLHDDAGIFAKAIELIMGKLPDRAIPESEQAVAYGADPITLLPGQTAYVRADLSLPLNGRGDFYVEAAAESGAYGLLTSSWDGSWNYRVPIDIDSQRVEAEGTFVAALKLDSLPDAFWQRVDRDGADLRFVDSSGDIELPYWLASFDRDERTGIAWVRVPGDASGTTTRIYAYYGEPNAVSRSDPFAPLRTSELVPRATLIGPGQSDMTLEAVALDENVEVRAGGHDAVTLKKGEATLFDSLSSGSTLDANGPVALTLISGGEGSIIPMGYTGTNFVLPGGIGPKTLSLTLPEDDDTHAVLRHADATSSVLDPLRGTVVSDTVDLATSLTIDATNDVIAMLSSEAAPTPVPIYPASDRPLLGFSGEKTVIGYGSDASTMKANCTSGGAQSADGRRAGMSTTMNTCLVSRFPALQDAVRISGIANPIGALSLSSEHPLGFLPRDEFSSSYSLLENSDEIMLLCAPEDKEMSIGAFDSSGAALASTTCEGRGVRPGKALLEREGGFPGGITIRSEKRGTTTPLFLAAFRPSGRSLASGESSPLMLIPSPQLFRSHSPNSPRTVFGEEEFVVPGEHRKLDVDKNGNERPHVDKLLSEKREFTVHELPDFRFQYSPQSNAIVQGVRGAFGVAPFTVSKVTIDHPTLGIIDAEYDIAYGDNDTWTLAIKRGKENIKPGRYTLHIEIEEGGDTYVDEYDFYWGVLAINYNKSMFTPGEKADIWIGALSDNGNTICDADLKLWITPPLGVAEEIPVSPSGECNGNNVVDVPDYSASYQLSSLATGTYVVKLVRLDREGNVASQIDDRIDVVDSVPLVIERQGPTRIYPVSLYTMKLRVTANVDFNGDIVERLPGDFDVTDRGGANLEWGDSQHSFITASWSVDMKAGQTLNLSYKFDPPDRSPYLYLLGPAASRGNVEFVEAREWQIASDAAGRMLIFWDGTSTPAGWTCVSCLATDPFSQRFVMGSSTYGGQYGTSTHTPTVTATVYSADPSFAFGPATTNNRLNAPTNHSHTFTPTLSAESNLPRYRNLAVMRSNSAGEPATLPAGAIALFNIASSSLPSSWNRYASEDGYHIRGASTSTVGTTGGSNTSSTTISGAIDAATGSGLRSNNALGPCSSAAHTHNLTATSSDVQDNQPPYTELLLAKLTSATTTPNYIITMWDDTPPAQWTTLSNPGGSLEGRFLKASTTYGFSGGASTHQHADIIGATTGAAVGSNVCANNASNAQALATHTHSVDLTGFSNDTTLPPYTEVIFAERFNGVTFYDETNYRIYANKNGEPPTDPWPPGTTDLAETTPVSDPNQALIPSNVMRLRIALTTSNATTSVGSQAFKLQYSAADDCTNALNWDDVAAIGSTTALWRGYDNAGVTNNATLAGLLLTGSTVSESYVEQNNSTGTPNQLNPGSVGEWDWVIQDNAANPGTNYCFRMAKSNGSALENYTEYPQVLTNSAPGIPTTIAPFNYQKTNQTSPDFKFAAVDIESNDLDYEIQISTSSVFATTVIDKDSTVNPELFDNLSNPTNKAPFFSGDTIHFAPTSPLTNGTTYYWRVRSKDSNASNSWGSWSSQISFTIDTSVTITTWHQTMSPQFQGGTFSNTNSSTSDLVMLNVGSTTGTIWSPEIDFALTATATTWGSISWSDQQVGGTIAYHLEYLSATGTWNLVPDSDLSGNSSGFFTSPVSLLTVDATTYTALRLRADFTQVGASPKLFDWTLTWGTKVGTPTLTSPFDNAKVGTTTPSFIFAATSPQGNAIRYQFQWSTDPTFTASTTRTSGTNSGFVDQTVATKTDPFYSGDTIQFTIQAADALTNGTTYFWRVRAIDPPPGLNIYSFWSDVRSITVDTSLTSAIWYQTVDGQWNTDTLSGMETFASNTLRVATNTDEAMMVYGEGTVQTPKYRIWNGTAWGSQQSALSVGGTIKWVQMRSSPVYGEYLMGTLGSNNDVILQSYINGAWGNKYTITGTVSNSNARGFDLEYETISGRAIAVSCDGDSNPTYAIWSGSSTSWVATGTVNLTSTNNCEWVRLAANPKTNEIIGLFRDTGARYEAQVWNGTTSSWGNANTTLGGVMTETAHEGMALGYETSANQAVVTVSNANNGSFRWSAWNGSVWSAVTTRTIRDDYEWGNIATDPNSDNMVNCFVDQGSQLGVSFWNGTTWGAATVLSTIGDGKNDGRNIDCAYETTAGHSGYVMAVYGTTARGAYREWNGATWSAEAGVPTSTPIARSALAQTARTNGGGILSTFFNITNLREDFSRWSGVTWSQPFQTIESSPSVTASPYKESFMMTAKKPPALGSVVSTPINFSDGNAPAWDKVLWTAMKLGTSAFKVQIQYYNSASSSWELIPDSDLPGNSTGTSTSPINIKNLNTDTYGTIRLVGNGTCSLGLCPYLQDWQVQWAQGLNIYGTAKQHDLTTNVTSGTVAVAVNGVLQSGKTGTISGGNWSISNVTFFPGNTVEVFVQGAATSARAAAIAIYDGPGDFSGLVLNEHWLTLGTASSSLSTTTLTSISRYDNSVSGSNDLFFDVTAGGDLNMCALALTAGCYDAGIYTLAGNVFQPGTTSAKTITTYDFRIGGGVYLGANSLKVGGSWRNLGGFTGGSGTVTFNATSTSQAIDSTGAATSTFSNVTFGESGNTGTWTFGSAFIATGTVNMNFGTVTPGSQAMTFQGDLTIGASGKFQKGTATTSFSGSTASSWTDNTASKQDLGNITVNGTSKTLTLGSSVKATNLNIATGNTLNAGGSNTLSMLGFWDNLGTFTAQTGTVSFIATSSSKTINQGTSNFYNLTFNGVAGSWRWLNTNATTTNDLTIATGTVTLPGGTLEVAGSFLNTGGGFAHNSGIVKMISTATGKSIQVGTSTFNDLTFNGTGGSWSFVDTNATTSGTLTVIAGTPTFPSGVLEIGSNFSNAATFVANGGTMKFTSTLNSRTITLGGSSPANLTVQNAGIFTITDANATVTGNVTLVAGTTTLPTTNFTIGGSFTNTGRFTAGSGIVTFNAASGSKTITAGSSSFAYVSLNGAGSFTVVGNATTTNDFTITSVGGFTQSSGTTLAVGGIFSNLVGGATTTWTGSTLSLTSGTSYSINTKSAGGDLYGTIRIAAGMQIRSWNSSSTIYSIDPTSSLYSQNHNSVVGEVDIFGAYTKNSGTDYWDYAIDFDGTALGGSPRQAVVKFASGASATFSPGSSLEILGTTTATTTINNQGSGNYGITFASSTLNASYYQFRNMNASGLTLNSSTTVTSLSYGDFSVDVSGGTGITIASSTIATNPAIQIFNVKFATSTGIAAAFNVTESGTAISFWRFKQHYGNIAGENYDNDPGGNPGYVRWDDSNFVISISGTVYGDAGVTPIGGPTCDGVTQNVRVKVAGQGNYAASCSATSSYYSVTGVTFSGDTVMTVYLDTNGGARGAIVTKSASADLSGYNIYQHRVILRHEDVSPMSIADMKAYDKTNDTDVPFTAATSSIPYTLTVDPDNSLFVWNAKTFVPGGNITLNSGGSGGNYDGTLQLDNNSIFTGQGTESHSVGGGIVVGSGATLTTASTTFTFMATTTGKSIIGVAPLSFWRVTFSGSGGGWSIDQTMNVGENFLASAGTVSGNSNILVSGTSITGAGRIAMGGGTFTLVNGGTFSSGTDWSFNNLTFGNGTIATTTKNGSSTVTVGGVLTASANQVFQAGTSSTWLLTGNGVPLVLSGALSVQNAVFRYSGSGAVTATAATYAQLDFGALGTSSPVYTLGSGTFSVGGSFNVGTTTGSLVTVNANTNDPTLTLSGDVLVRASSTFVLSDTGSLTARRNWSNQGTTTASGGTVTFDATTTGFAVNPGNSSFANVIFNNASGGWTIPVSATATGAFTLSAAASFTLSANTTLSVGGVFTNAIGGPATTWASSTLYLNLGTGETINAKSVLGDTYGTILVGANTQARMWNSSAATTTTLTGASLYSMNHASSTGALNIYGSYNHSSGTDYWDYATDFDGTALSTSTSRIVTVTIASSSQLSFTGGTLEALGVAGATTSIDVASGGGYAFSVSGGSLNMQYYKLRGADANGISISGTTNVIELGNADYLLSRAGGTMMTVAGGTIDANPLKTFFGMSFATSSGISSGYNITATGVSASVWSISGLNGNYAGEAFDNDPGGDPGYIRWDDSAAQITVSGNVYTDEGQTPMGSPICDGVTQNVRLKVQGAGTYSSACNSGTGAFSISSIIYNPKDTLTLFLASTTGARAVNIAYDPVTNITTMHLYQNRVILRHEQGTAVGIREMAKYDNAKDASIPFTATTTGATSTTLFSGTGIVVWNSKVFAPGGNVTIHGNASSTIYDGSVHLLSTSTWSSSGTESYSLAGNFFADSAASIAPANSTFTFTATTSGKSITATNSLTFYNLSFSGSAGAWTTSGVSTTSNDLTISAGTVTLPAATLYVGGSFNNSAGAFVANGGTVQFTASASGKNIRTGSSAFWNTLFSGSGGGWTYLDTNSTTSGTTTITAGTLTLPSGVFSQGRSFDNQSGTIAANGGTLKMIATSSGQIVRLSGSSLANFQAAATGTYQFVDSYATTTGSVTLSFGTTTFPYAALAVGGTFSNAAVFTAGTSTLVMNGSGAGKTMNFGSSSAYNVLINNSGGNFTVSSNATTTNDFTLASASSFTQSSGTTLAVGGVFTNLVGGAATTWTNTILSLSGTSANYTINTKSAGGDAYETMRLATSTNVRMWGSSATTTQLTSSSSIYSMNNNAVPGSLYIYGNYAKNSGTDYWSYATDFDGVSLGGSSRQANVRFAANATATYSNAATLSMLGSAAASTSVDRISSGNYALILSSAYWNATYYQFRNMGLNGVYLSGTTTITSMQNGDFSIDVQNGSGLTIASTSIDQNASTQQFYVKFATSSGITSAYNVTRIGTTSNSITFNSEYGSLAGEAYDNDGSDGCGSIRWTDSSCLISDERGFRWRNDDGGEGVPASEWYNQSWTKRERVRIVNNATSSFTNEQVQLSLPYQSEMQSNFADLRFTDSSGTTSIPFWTESYLSAATATVWVKVPSLAASSYSDIFVYFGNATATYAGVGTSTFAFFDDFEDGNISEYSGDSSLFANSTSFNYERAYGLAPSSGNTGAQTTSGIGQVSAGVGRDTSFRFNQYIDMSSGGSDEPCFLFAIQSPITLHQNYGVCLSPFGADHVVIAKNVANNGRNDGSTQLSSKTVTYSTGWYQTQVDWIATGNQINVSVYDNTGALFATTSASDSSYTSGGVGFSFWGMHGGWDIPFARTYNYVSPSYTIFTKQSDSGATWAAAENAYLPNYPQNQNVRLRVSVRNSSLATLNDNFRLQYAAKLASPNCESVPSGNYVDVPTTSGGCGSDAACMTSSAQFTNKSSSTPLLSIPTGYTFAQAQILEDPSNQTDTVAVAASQFTEIEYNLQMTSSASLDRYCLRTTNAGAALDNYTRVAEIQVLHPPTISGLAFNGNQNIALVEGTTTTIFATGTVSDLNGYGDIVAASSTYYRSSVAGGRSCAADNNNCYQIATTSCSFTSCSGNSCTISCSANLYYFADPTDVGSTYAADVWNALVDVWDTSSAHNNSTANQELYTLSALTTTSTIPYGSITVGGDSGASNATTSVNNTGNNVLNTRIYANGPGLVAGSNVITPDKQKYATSTFTYSACSLCSPLTNSTSTSPYALGVAKPTTTTSVFKNIFWGIGIPIGTAATSFTGSTTFEAVAGP